MIGPQGQKLADVGIHRGRRARAQLAGHQQSVRPELPAVHRHGQGPPFQGAGFQNQGAVLREGGACGILIVETEEKPERRRGQKAAAQRGQKVFAVVRHV